MNLQQSLKVFQAPFEGNVDEGKPTSIINMEQNISTKN
jgi:hypothetical protein